MTSILDQTASLARYALHDCGGTILAGPDTYDGPQAYCDTCGAYAYGDGPVPTGTDREANQAASDAGELSSPDA